MPSRCIFDQKAIANRPLRGAVSLSLLSSEKNLKPEKSLVPMRFKEAAPFFKNP
jgi:hypothetical protein